MNKPGFRERFSYWFDNWMSRGTLSLIALLGIATVVLVVVMFGVVELFRLFGFYPNDNPETSPLEVLWGNLMRTLDSGAVGGDTGWVFRILMLVLTLVGLVIVASLIGIVSGGFDARVEELRKGRSRVLESDHTLILGWSSKVFSIVNELSIANASRKKAVIVVLAPRDKVEMEDEIRDRVEDFRGTKVIVRSGDPMTLTDLELASPQTARSIILLAPEGDDDPDSVVIKTALAVTNNPDRKDGRYHIVGEIRDESNLEVARLVGKDEAHWVLARDVISRIMVQTSRQSGLSVVYSELLDFDGAEMYFASQPTLVGKTFFDAQLAFDDSMVIGIVRDDAPMLNPSAKELLVEGDQLIVIAEDDSTIHLAPAPGEPDTSLVSKAKKGATRPEKTLVLGWNPSLAAMLEELDEYATPRSRVTVVATSDPGGSDGFDNIDVNWLEGDPTNRRVLDDLRPETFDHILVLAADDLPHQRSDARTLVSLLHLRDIADRKGVDVNVVSEMLDDRNRELAEVTEADDFIISDKLVSLMLSQLSENEQLTDVFADLFSSEGSEIYLRAAEDYVKLGVGVEFYTVLEAARRKGETAIGLRIAAHSRSEEHMYGVNVNPTKTEQHVYEQGDKIIVLAER